MKENIAISTSIIVIDNELDIIHGIEPLEYYLGIVFMHFAE